MKKLLVSILCLGICCAVFAGPQGGQNCRPCRPHRPCHPWGWRYNCDRGLGNAAAICSIISSGLNIANNLTTPAVYAAPVAPIVQQAPVVAVPTSVAAAPVVTAPVVQPAVPAYYSQPVYVSTPAPVVVAPYGRAGRVVYYGR